MLLIEVKTASYALQAARVSTFIKFLIWNGSDYVEATTSKIWDWAAEKAKFGREHPNNNLNSLALIAVFDRVIR